MLDTVSSQAKAYVYSTLSGDPSLLALLPGGLHQMYAPEPNDIRIDLGPHILYFVGGFMRERFRQYRVQVVMLVVVPNGTYTLDSEQVGMVEYSERILDKLAELFERQPGSGEMAQNFQVSLVPSSGYIMWQVITEVPVVKRA